MSRLKHLSVLTLALVAFPGCTHMRHRQSQQAQQRLQYPKTATVDHVDEYNGVKVADPYRWLEDPDSEQTRAWVEAENKVTFGYLEQIADRDKIRQRLTDLWNYEKYGLPFKRGGRYFMSKNDGLQNQSVLYTMDSLDAEPRVLLDPNTLSDDGTVALSTYAISEDGKYMAYGLSSAGSDWQEWEVRDIDTGKDLDDHLQWIKFSGPSWTHDNKGFFYTRFDEPKEGQELQSVNRFPKLCYHRLGTPQSEDALVYSRPDKEDWTFGGGVTDDGQYLIIGVEKGSDTNNLIFYKDLTKPDSPVVELISKFEAQWSLIDNDGPVFWFQTDDNAPRNRVVAIDIRKPERENWREIIPQAEDTLRGVSAIDNKFIATYLKDAASEVRIFDLEGNHVRDLDLPSLGTVYGFGGRRNETETFYYFTSFSTPGTVYRYDVPAATSTVFREPKVDFNPDDFETRQVFYHSKDGTRCPMFITYRKGLKLDGNNPTYLYGYGGFNITMPPHFSVSNLVWMEMGGVYAQANIRGGGEYGREWHLAGTKLHKQNCFDDFIAAAEWLIDNDYTSSKKLAIGGGSNGGLLVAACMVQRPDLFGAVLPAVGVLDMLRFNKFTIGWAWVADYGSPEVPEEFKALYAYSPLHNLKPGTKYPACMLTTADHDDRVVPAHSFKFAATLQRDQAGDAPVLIRIETRAGHGGGKPTTKRIEEQADEWAFLTKVFDMHVKWSS